MNHQNQRSEEPKKNTSGSRKKGKIRKKGVNRNRFGSVRSMNGQVYVDFMYLSERVRESSRLPWNETNVEIVRDQLDRINMAIKNGTFRFAEVFPNSKKVQYFTEKEDSLRDGTLLPHQVLCHEYMDRWINRLKGTKRVEERTLLSYKDLIHLYLKPFFQGRPFSDLNLIVLEDFYIWARKQKRTVKQSELKMIRKQENCSTFPDF